MKTDLLFSCAEKRQRVGVWGEGWYWLVKEILKGEAQLITAGSEPRRNIKREVQELWESSVCRNFTFQPAVGEFDECYFQTEKRTTEPVFAFSNGFMD